MDNNNINLVKQYINLYLEYQKKYGDKTLVLLQNGKFYECYSITEDKTIDGKLIGPNCKHLEDLTNVSMFRKGKNKDNVVDYNNPIGWGFPLISENKYIPDLIYDGYTIIIYNQEEQNGKFIRTFNKILSPGTYINENDNNYSLSNFINCIYIEEPNGKNNNQNNFPLYCIGLCAIDVGTGKVYVHEALSKLNDNNYCLDEAIRFNNGINPKEIIIIKEDLNLSDNDIKKVLNINDNSFIQIYNFNPNYNKLSFQRNLLNKVYSNLSKSLYDILDILNISDKIYIQKALSHLLIYISEHYTNLITNLNEPIFYFQNDRLFLGNDAINQLNIINNDISLNDIINKPGTLMCKRYIKELLTSPFTNIDKLNDIYNSAELFKDNYNEIFKQLKNIYDLEKIFRKIQLNNLNINRFYEFYKSLININKLFDLLSNEIKNKLKIDNNKLNELNELINYINDIIDINNCNNFSDKNINNIFKKSFGNDELFKQIQTLFINLGNNKDIINIIYNKLNNLIGGNDKKPMITLKNNNKKGYYFVITNKRFELLKEKFNNPLTINDNMIIEINNFNIESKKSFKELYLPVHDDYDTAKIYLELYELINKYYFEFLNSLLLKNDLIKYFINLIIEIDYYNTIIKTSIEYNYTKPIINNSSNCFIDVVNLRHPIVEQIINYEYIPHSLKLGVNFNGIMIYGLNSAGKSVLMKAVGLCVILAQCGFYVPAEQFIFKPFKALYTRITGNDNIYKGLSSYMLEMNELNNIIKRANNETLIIGDEICRGTEHISGNIIVATTILKLLKLKSLFLFATHLHEIMELPSIKNNPLIKAYFLSVKYENGKLIYDRILKEGVGEKIYGVIVAEQVIKDKEYNDLMSVIKKEVFDIKDLKFSNYNKKLIMDCCEYCGSKKNLNTHHIHFQKNCENGFSKNNSSVKKNGINNLIVLCDDCHKKLHNGEININTKILTSDGIEIN